MCVYLGLNAVVAVQWDSNAVFSTRSARESGVRRELSARARAAPGSQWLNFRWPHAQRGGETELFVGEPRSESRGLT